MAFLVTLQLQQYSDFARPVCLEQVMYSKENLKEIAISYIQNLTISKYSARYNIILKSRCLLFSHVDNLLLVPVRKSDVMQLNKLKLFHALEIRRDKIEHLYTPDPAYLSLAESYMSRLVRLHNSLNRNELYAVLEDTVQTWYQLEVGSKLPHLLQLNKDYSYDSLIAKLVIIILYSQRPVKFKTISGLKQVEILTFVQRLFQFPPHKQLNFTKNILLAVDSVTIPNMQV
jgi:hypothetical protein